MCTYDMKGEVKVSRGTNGTKCSGEEGESWDGRSLLDVHCIIVWKYLCNTVPRCHWQWTPHSKFLKRKKKVVKLFKKKNTNSKWKDDRKKKNARGAVSMRVRRESRRDGQSHTVLHLIFWSVYLCDCRGGTLGHITRRNRHLKLLMAVTALWVMMELRIFFITICLWNFSILSYEEVLFLKPGAGRWINALVLGCMLNSDSKKHFGLVMWKEAFLLGEA